MIEPVSFRYNEQTAPNNHYQNLLIDDNIQCNALKEFRSLVSLLRKSGVNVFVIQDTLSPETPDSIFPNNWISTYSDGSIFVHPMYAKNRRLERRSDVLDLLRENFIVNDVYNDVERSEKSHQFLEGTGSMVLDRTNKIAYASISERTNKGLFLQFCNDMGFQPICFTSMQNINERTSPIYHTNVMMSIADTFAIICLESIHDANERELVVRALSSTKKEIIEISESQKYSFAGNMLQVIGDKKYLVMSTSAYKILDPDQISRIMDHNDIIHSSLTTIESCGGGSVRCMMAEIFLPLQR